MQSFFTIHPGEFLVGDYITRHLRFDVWVPTKDTGVDLLLTPRGKSNHAIKLQVKFSRSYDGAAAKFKDFVVLGWYTLDREKIGKSEADYWVFVIADFRRKMQFLIVPTAELKRRIRGSRQKLNLYLTICGKKAMVKCFDTRDMSNDERVDLFADSSVRSERDYTTFLNNWECLGR
jgi:hypothetical protein